MASEPNEREPMVHGRRRRGLRWLFLIGVVVLAGVMLALVIPNQDDRDVASKGPGGADPDIGGAVGTAGVDTDYGPSEGTLGTIITELETITGANDATQLVGQRVDLHVDVHEVVNEVAFWAGPPDNRLLVVMARDNRTGLDKQTGNPSHHDLTVARAGQQATISGVVRRIPNAEATHSWKLTRRQVEELAERGVYVQAQEVSLNGHGSRAQPPSGR
jgi:hypothetical protein